jgi:diguanylate cyclase (GGDEF)-like protein
MSRTPREDEHGRTPRTLPGGRRTAVTPAAGPDDDAPRRRSSVVTAVSRTPFVARWILAVALSMAVGSGVEYVGGSRALEARVLEEALHGYEADLEGLEEALGSGLTGSARQYGIEAALRAVGRTHGTAYVGLFQADGTPIDVVGGEADLLDPARAHGVAMTGVPLVAPESDEGEDEEGRYEFLLPVASPDGTLVVEIDQHDDLVGDMVRDMGMHKLLTLALGLVVAVPLSYLLGGRSLHRRQRSAERTADTDALTGLAGRRPFRPTLEASLADPSGSGVVLALVDIDDFKQVNDRLGHSYGDRVLCALADAFGTLRASDVAFRLGGDEFAVVMRGLSEALAGECLERVRRSLADRAPGITFSAGLAGASPADGLDQRELWERADAALYDAKARGRRRTVAFGEMTSSVTVSAEKIDAVAALLAAGDGLTVAFQPIWDLRSGRVLGHEALLRLPAGTPIDGPQEAFMLAQRFGSAAQLDALARRAVLDAVRSRDWEGLLFVNVHPDALPGLDVDALLQDVTAAGLTASDVILEVTEHAGLDRPEALRVLASAHDAGLRLALDDMGQGNAGLRALTHVRFDVVKLDRAVVARLGTDPASDATVAAATTFVQQTGGWVIAEGIEDTAMLDAVLGADERPSAETRLAGQGYLLGRPDGAPVAIATRLDVLPEPAGEPSGDLLGAPGSAHGTAAPVPA